MVVVAIAGVEKLEMLATELRVGMPRKKLIAGAG